jgi:flagellar biosynthesis/type III secretory pathway protein FliH
VRRGEYTKSNFPNRTVLTFEYDVIQLNRLDWRAFIKKPNPVAAALMAKMHIAPKDRPRVKWDCLRLLTTLKLDEARSRLISGFIDSYLRLNAQEHVEFEARARAMGDADAEEVMEIVTSWKKEGIKEGIKEGLRRGRKQGLQKGRLEGIREGRIGASREALIEVLESRFKRVPAATRRAIESIEEPQRLTLLLREAIVVASLKEFEERLS